MQLFNSGRWDGNPSQEIEADTAYAAAEFAAGETLLGRGKVADFRASVWEADTPYRRGLYFYRAPKPTGDEVILIHLGWIRCR